MPRRDSTRELPYTEGRRANNELRHTPCKSFATPNYIPIWLSTDPSIYISIYFYPSKAYLPYILLSIDLSICLSIIFLSVQYVFVSLYSPCSPRDALLFLIGAQSACWWLTLLYCTFCVCFIACLRAGFVGLKIVCFSVYTSVYIPTRAALSVIRGLLSYFTAAPLIQNVCVVEIIKL